MTRFTRHARNRLRLWRLSEADVLAVLLDPSFVTPTRRGRKNAWKLVKGTWLRVTHVEEDEDTVVITVTVRRRGPEEV